MKSQAWVTKVLYCPATAFVLLCLSAGIATAQELAPRAYWPTPVGTRLVMTGYSLSTGDIVTDPSLPITGVDSQIHSMLVGYQQTFDVLGRTTNARIELPYVIGTTKGTAFGQPAQRDLNGIGELRNRHSGHFRSIQFAQPVQGTDAVSPGEL